MMPPAEDEQSTAEGGEGVGGFALLRALKSGSARKVRPGMGGGSGMGFNTPFLTSPP